MVDLELPAMGQESEAVERARAFLRGERDIPGVLPSVLGERLVQSLVRAGDTDKLTRLATLGDKALAKAARRGLHQLRTRGVPVEVPRPTSERSLSLTVDDGDAQPASLASAIAQDGERMVWLAQLDGEGKVLVFQATTHEVRGLIEFQAFRATRKQWRSSVHEMYALDEMPIGPMPASHIRCWLEDAAARSSGIGRIVPREYAESRHAMIPVAAPAQHPVFDLVSRAAIVAASDELDRLITLPETATWTPPEEEVQKLGLRAQEIATSRLVIDQAQRVTQLREAALRATREALAGPWKQRLHLRLLETALVILARAEVARRDRDYLKDAALLVAAAEHLTEDAAGPVLDEIPAHLGWVVQLFERVLGSVLHPDPRHERSAPAPKSGPLIVA